MILLIASILGYSSYIWLTKRTDKVDGAIEVLESKASQHQVVLAKNFPIYEFTDTRAYEAIKDLVKTPPQVRPGDGIGSSAGLWASVVLKPSVETDEKAVCYVLNISGEYILDEKDDPMIKVGLTSIYAESMVSGIATRKDLGAYREFASLEQVYDLMRYSKGVPRPKDEGPNMAAAPSTSSVFTMIDESVFQAFDALKFTDLVAPIAQEKALATIFIHRKVAISMPEKFLKVEVFATQGFMKFYEVNRDATMMTTTFKGVVNHPKYWQKLVNQFGEK